jgi:hypothetical protein
VTDSLTWEDLPARDPATGYLTTAGYIPFNQNLVRKAVIFGYVHHVIECTVKVVFYHKTIFPVWFPIDVSRSPLFEIIIVMQVCSHC